MLSQEIWTKLKELFNPEMKYKFYDVQLSQEIWPRLKELFNHVILSRKCCRDMCHILKRGRGMST